MNHLQQLTAIRAALTAAQLRTGRTPLATRVEKGRVQIVDVSYLSGGRSAVQELSTWLTYDECVARLNDMDGTP